MARRVAKVPKVRRAYTPPGSVSERASGAPQRIAEDDPRWNPRTMGNRRGRTQPFPMIRERPRQYWT